MIAKACFKFNGVKLLSEAVKFVPTKMIRSRYSILNNSHSSFKNQLIDLTAPKKATFELYFKRNAGHNKWSKIRHAKGATDLKRGTQFAKMGLELQAAIRAGGTDPQLNLRLAAALAAAKGMDLPKKNIENAFKKATGQADLQMEEVVYQAMGPHQVAVVVEAFTDNKNRTVKSVRSVVTRAGGAMTDVSWMFQKKGKVVIHLGSEEVDSDRILDDVLEAGGDDFTIEEGRSLEVTCEFETLGRMSKELQGTGRYALQSIAPYYHFNTTWAQPEGKDEREVEEEISAFLETLEDLEDVVRIHTNLP
ncbi:hypothetical protein DSO57_1020166 [Entomophthora muscae]|uniref:Uncharacterized protein n=1 Tax=Entomophthora muscae TaxID=34485 RepID=A0ACC2RII7_9FUNG|nr:hypothetical protein DSO57_1020166 [Entomophthora muscae]